MLQRRFSKFALLVQDAAEKGILLLLATIMALIVANSKYFGCYQDILNQTFSIVYGKHAFELSVHAWINDFLMAIFFFLVGMEIKREMIEGNLASKEQRILPVICAMFGVLIPVLIYISFNYNDPVKVKGWAVPAATDIAFALGMLSLFGRNVPVSLKVFLTALAIIDDLMAVVIIALFYSNNLDLSFLLYIGFICCLIVFLAKAGLVSVPLYLALGIGMWYCFYKSGIHATIGGVVLGFLIPLYRNGNKEDSPLKDLEQGLHKLVAYVILPLFAFTNSGLNLSGLSFASMKDSIPLGIILGLFFGKQIGVFLSGLLLIKLKICRMPDRAGYLQFYGVAVLCGIGFTMSLFVGILAFEHHPKDLSLVQMGVLTGSLLCSIYSAIILQISKLRK
ncbi:Na+/H+ antiporter NhaA [Candidatus Jidaibacter acanthamoebae]|nr:Na+/H+ antiporter NhaA [Candidatus Jidaibacter acanthamoeba]